MRHLGDRPDTQAEDRFVEGHPVRHLARRDSQRGVPNRRIPAEAHPAAAPIPAARQDIREGSILGDRSGRQRIPEGRCRYPEGRRRYPEVRRRPPEVLRRPLARSYRQTARAPSSCPPA